MLGMHVYKHVNVSILWNKMCRYMHYRVKCFAEKLPCSNVKTLQVKTALGQCVIVICCYILLQGEVPSQNVWSQNDRHFVCYSDVA